MGFLRLYFSCIVIITHTWFDAYGMLAVYGFFTLSGYLIALSASETYGPSMQGKARFLFNRFLRIYPAYWACLLLSLCMLQTNYLSCDYASVLVMPETLNEWLKNIFIFGLKDAIPERGRAEVIPPAWSLSIEMSYYLLIGLVLAHSRRLSIALFLFALAWAFFRLAVSPASSSFMMTYQSALPAFMAGVAAYHLREYLPKANGALFHCLRFSFLLALTLPCLMYVSGGAMPFSSYSHWGRAFIYAAVFILALCLPAWSRKEGAGQMGAWNRHAGDLSYTLFLIHMLVAKLLLCNVSGMEKSPVLFVSTLFISLPVCLALHAAVEVPIRKYRSQLRKRSECNSIL